MRLRLAACAGLTVAMGLGLPALSGSAYAQNLPAAATQSPTIKRTPLQKFDVPGTNHETVIGLAEIVANATSAGTVIPGQSPATCWTVSLS